MPRYVFQAVDFGPGGEIRLVCHEKCFEAHDLESAIVVARALNEVMPIAEACNSIRVLTPGQELLWSGPLEGEAGED